MVIGEQRLNLSIESFKLKMHLYLHLFGPNHAYEMPAVNIFSFIIETKVPLVVAWGLSSLPYYWKGISWEKVGVSQVGCNCQQAFFF